MTGWLRISRQVCFAALSAIVCACSISTVCTLIGCESGITVHLTSFPSGPFRIDVRPAGGQGAVYVFDCSSGAVTCRQDIFFADLIADHLFIAVTAAGVSRDTEITTDIYESSSERAELRA